MNFEKIRQNFQNFDYTVAALSIIFGIGSWLGVNATFVQVPLLVKTAPEEWKLPSYMGIINLCANIGPVVYTLINKYYPKRVRDDLIIILSLCLGSLATFLMIFFYEFSVEIRGEVHSLPLFILFWCLAFIGCMSSVLFMPYMGRFEEIYLIMYFIGEGFSGLLVSFVGLVQGVGGNEKCAPNNSSDGPPYKSYTPLPRFEPREFFMFVFFMMLCSLLSFLLLNNLSRCKQYIAVRTEDDKPEQEIESTSKGSTQTALLPLESCKFLLFLMFLISSFEDGILASIQSYSCLPYGNVAYHLTVSFTLIVNPISALSAMFLPKLQVRQISVAVGLNTMLGLYILSTAIMSPNPFLVNTKVGAIIIIAIWTVFIAIFTFIKINISTLLRFQGGKFLLWAGASSQFGFSFGAIIIFYFVNVLKLFVAKDPCV